MKEKYKFVKKKNIEKKQLSLSSFKFSLPKKLKYALFIFFILFVLIGLFFISPMGQKTKDVALGRIPMYNYLRDVLFSIYSLEDELNPFLSKNTILNFDLPQYNILLSPADIRYFNQQAKEGKEIGYMSRTIENDWRKAELYYDDGKERKKYDIKIKLHGQTTENCEGKKKAYNVKFTDENINSVREMDFIMPLQADGVSSMFSYNIAEELDLMTIYNDFAVLKINGIVQGLYYIEENADAYLLEKNSISNGVVTKIHDEWNDIDGNWHVWRYNYQMGALKISNKTIMSEVSKYATYKLYEAIKDNDTEYILNNMDIDKMSRFEAGKMFLKENHMLAGDNIKLIYTFTDGKFIPLFRNEGYLLRYNSYEVEYENNYYYDGKSHLYLFSSLNRDNDFRKIKYSYLYELVKDDHLLKMYDNLTDKYGYYLTHDLTNVRPTRYYKYLLKDRRELIENNINILRRYLEYSRVFIGVIEERNQIIIDINPDSNSPVAFSKLEISLKNQAEINGSIILEEYDEKNMLVYSQNISVKDLYDVSRKLRYNSYMLNIDEEMKTKDAKYYVKLIFPVGYRADITDAKITLKNTISNKQIKENDIFVNIADANDFYTELRNYNIHEFIKENSFFNFEINDNTAHLEKGDYYINKTTIFPKGYILNIEEGTKIYLEEDVSFVSYSPVNIYGSMENPVKITSVGDAPFGTFAFVGEEKETININYLEISNGNEAVIDGIYLSGALSLYHTNVGMRNTKVFNNNADDGLNIKYGTVNIIDSSFFGNAADQIDLDFCKTYIYNSTFEFTRDDENGDGLDLSGSTAVIEKSEFKNFQDKGISVGENSIIFIESNAFLNNKNGIAVKDKSNAYLYKNIFQNNINDVVAYQKKEIFGGGNIIAVDRDKDSLKFELDNKSTINFIDYTEYKNYYESFKSS
ncbi:MAG: hypothetical protein KAI55_04120 [Candidatus Aenigmarchaeota archaeon]|nr:hypothetical protein [Candidatus Aenigmarchaeota archaeon]